MDRGRDRGDRSQSFTRARNHFEHHRNKRKSDENQQHRHNYDRDDSHRASSRRRSSSPSRWERGKKQKQKTMTDVPPDRELFVGNIPSTMDERFLLHFINGAMRLAQLCGKHDSPALSCQINAPGNFAFVEMQDAATANQCLNLNGILFLNARIKVGRPKKYAGPFVVSQTWQEMMGEKLSMDQADLEQEKVNRELFVGNTTPEMTDQMLKDFLGSAMEQVGLNIMEGNAITLCELFGKYAFIELRTPREAANALNLNNIPFMGSHLQITRPSKYKGEPEQHSNWEHILARFNMKPEDFQLGQILNPSVISATSAATPVEGDSIEALKAELTQVKRALEITRNQLDEANKKSEARKEQLVSLNKKWAEGKNELSEKKHELAQIIDGYSLDLSHGLDSFLNHGTRGFGVLSGAADDLVGLFCALSG